MRLHEAAKLAKDCGLTTVQEMFDNVRIHAGQMFAYQNVADEVRELYDDIDAHRLAWGGAIPNPTEWQEIDELEPPTAEREYTEAEFWAHCSHVTILDARVSYYPATYKDIDTDDDIPF